jgi:hypothetical protein
MMRDLNACAPAREWVGNRTVAQAWAECSRGDWLIWWAERTGVDRRLVVRAACACARLALPYVPEGEDRPRLAIETAEAWARGEATLDYVRAARHALDDDDLLADDATYAAYAAAHATEECNYARDAASFASVAAAKDGAAYNATLAQCADLVREIIR